MPDDLYRRDILAWSEQQAALLRRAAAGERVNDIDWPNIVEEIESVGRSELRACESLLARAIDHLLKLHGWPGHAAADHWRAELRVFLRDARAAFSPAMRQQIDVTSLYRQSRDLVSEMRLDGRPPVLFPASCAITLDALLADPPDVPMLLAAIDRPD